MRLTKYQVAFDHYPVVHPCQNCGGTDWESWSKDSVDIDIELLEMWYTDSTLSFCDQDEEVIIAEADISVFKEFLRAPDNEQKAIAVGSSLAEKLYNDVFENSKNRDWCIGWLLENKNSWYSTTEKYIIDQIKPLLKQSRHKK